MDDLMITEFLRQINDLREQIVELKKGQDHHSDILYQLLEEDPEMIPTDKYMSLSDR